jgi:hypothetical protein
VVVAAALLAAALAEVASASPAAAQGTPACSFVLGFAALREQVGADKVGRCLEDERFNAENGNAEQRTSGGLLVWRKVDNFTAFTDGATSWIAGPEGLQSRPNGERFAWEKDPIQPASASSASAPRPSASPGPAAAASPASTGPTQPTATPVGGSAPNASATPSPVSTTGPARAGTSAGPIGSRDPNAGVPPVNPTTCPADQPIKGDQGDAWIYHTPLSPAYRATQPERCFATSAAAEAAGYRPPDR